MNLMIFVENNEFVDKPNDLKNFDPRVWDGLDAKMKDILVEKGPIREVEPNFDFPVDAIGRHFPYDYFTRKLRNGDLIDRKWLVYSKKPNKVFCCKLFKTSRSRSGLASDGIND